MTVGYDVGIWVLAILAVSALGYFVKRRWTRPRLEYRITTVNFKIPRKFFTKVDQLRAEADEMRSMLARGLALHRVSIKNTGHVAIRPELFSDSIVITGVRDIEDYSLSGSASRGIDPSVEQNSLIVPARLFNVGEELSVSFTSDQFGTPEVHIRVPDAEVVERHSWDGPKVVGFAASVVIFAAVALLGILMFVVEIKLARIEVIDLVWPIIVATGFGAAWYVLVGVFRSK